MPYSSYSKILLTKNFALPEFLYSRVAVEQAIENIPNEAQIAALRALATQVLQPLRDRLGKPIAILSGYRCPKLNALVGGVPNSQHLWGEAADCFIAAGPEHLLQVLLESDLPFDQAIVYPRKKFLHLSYREGRCRRMVLRK